MNKVIVIILLCLFAFPAIADNDQLQDEIDHLLKYTQSSNCTFIRNGKVHSPAEAIKHILKKYDHFKDKIKTTEDFIDYCASKSMLSDQPYQISCPDQDVVESKIWFIEELDRIRNE